MAYAEVDVIHEGALEAFETFGDEALLREFLVEQEREAHGAGVVLEVYVRYHDHEPRECECAQYVIDHHPTYIFGPGHERAFQ